MVSSNQQVVEQKASRQQHKKERGASLVEYALLVALIAGAAVLAITAVGTAARDQLQGMSTTIANN